MKTTEFRKLVREEVRKILKEGIDFKVGDIVIPNMGPHKGIPHKVIAMFPGLDGKIRYNIKPDGLEPSKIKYRLGAAGATADQLTAA